MDPPTAEWHRQKEQSAGRLRMRLMWEIYRLLGKSAAKILFAPAFLFIYPFCTPARAALRQFYAVLGRRASHARCFRQLLGFAWTMIDKTDACTLCKAPPRFTLAGDAGWRDGGCFLLSTHVGCIEVLPALRKGRGATPKVHAFQQLGHDAIFTELFLHHLDPAQLTLHAVEDIGVETAAEMQAAIRRGEIVLMAGDRPAAGRARTAATLPHAFLGRLCRWPKGVFRFARLMESPVYAIACVQTGWNAYEVRARRLDGDLLDGYVAFLEETTRARPEQWYQFYRFFDGASTTTTEETA